MSDVTGRVTKIYEDVTRKLHAWNLALKRFQVRLHWLWCVAVRSVRENVCNNSNKHKKSCSWIKKNVKNVKRIYRPLNHSAVKTQLRKVSTGKSPTSNIVLRKVDTREYNLELRVINAYKYHDIGNFKTDISIQTFSKLYT